VSTPTTKPDAYRLARQHAEEGHYAQALEHVRDHLITEPNDTEALNDAGAILYAMGRFDEAIDHLRAATETQTPPAVETLLNLAEVHLAADRPVDALPMLGTLAEQQCLDPDLAVRVSTALLDQGRTPQAVEALAILKHLYPDTENEVAESALAVVRNHRPKVSFFSLPEEAPITDPIRDFLADRFEVRWSTEQDAERLEELLQWSDVAWFESCDSMFAVASHNPGYARLVCHMKMYKESNPWIDEVHWDNVAALIVSDELIARRIAERVDGLEKKTRVICVPNGLDFELLEEVPKATGTHVACIGCDNFRLRPELLDLLLEISRSRPQLQVSITPETPDDQLTSDENHKFTHRIKGTGIGMAPISGNPLDWLEDKQYIVATNYFAQRTPLLTECLALGVQPLVYVPEGETPGPLARWFGFTTATELEQRIFAEPHDPQRCRQLAMENFSLSAQLANLNNVMLDLEREWLDEQPEPDADSTDDAPEV
jgi:tetratricopeptide (TPR) repeat protein